MGRGSRAQLDRLAALIATSPHNLVSRHDRLRVRETHVAESEAVAQLLPVGSGQWWMDLGTGGGLPGLVLAWAFPRTQWLLLDATRKKVDAVREFAAVLGLRNVAAVQARAEELAHHPDCQGRFDGVVSRAVAPLPVLCELARGFLAPGGTLAAVKGPRWQQEVRESQEAFDVLGLTLVHSRRVESASRPTWLLTMRAEGLVPPGYPRGGALLRSRPLGA